MQESGDFKIKTIQSVAERTGERIGRLDAGE